MLSATPVESPLIQSSTFSTSSSSVDTQAMKTVSLTVELLFGNVIETLGGVVSIVSSSFFSSQDQKINKTIGSNEIGVFILFINLQHIIQER